MGPLQTTPKPSAHMRTIRKSDTKPEFAVRRLVHAMGYRFRLHRRDLPGTPDLVFVRLQKVIFVRGCFWHRHECPAGRKYPSANPHYWQPKLERNAVRDAENMQRLDALGWSALVLWECELADRDVLAGRVKTVVLSRGVWERLQVCPETLEVLAEKGIEVEVLQTEAAVKRFNKLRETVPTGGLFHSTC